MQRTASQIVAQITEEESYSHVELKKQPQQEEVFIADSPQTAFSKLEKFYDLRDRERMAYAGHLPELLELIGEVAYAMLEKTLDAISCDSFSVQLQAMNQMHNLIEQLKKRVTGYHEIKMVVLPFMLKYLTVDDAGLRGMACQELVFIAPYLTEQDRLELILNPVIELSYNSNKESDLIFVASLLGGLAQVVGQQICEGVLGKALVRIGVDQRQTLRETVLNQLGSISVASSQSFVQKHVIPYYLERCQEQSYQIKATTVKILPNLAKYSSAMVRDKILGIVMFDFLRDQDKKIRKQAYLILGQFIGVCKFSADNTDLRQNLLLFYLNMVDKSVTNLSNDPFEMLNCCAFNFPAVYQAFGRQSWPELKDLYMRLRDHTLEEVRRPIAFSFHEIAKIMGPELAKEELIDTFHKLINDPVQEIRSGVIKNLFKFIQIFDMEEREMAIDLLLAAQKDHLKWRARVVICVQVLQLSNCFDRQTVFQVISPIIFKMCSDPVSEVSITQYSGKEKGRQECSLLIGTLPHRFRGEIAHRKQYEGLFAIKTIHSQISVYNLLIIRFVWMCYRLMSQGPYFQEKFFKEYLELCSDPVQVVRISALKVVDRFMVKNSLQKDQKFLKQILLQFTIETNKEMVNIMSKYNFVKKQRKTSTRSNQSNKSGSSNDR